MTEPPDIRRAAERLKNVVRKTPLTRHAGLSRRFGCGVWLKFVQAPGAYNLMSGLPAEVLARGIITRFEYMKKTHKETGPALVGIELQKRGGYARLLDNLQRHRVDFTEVNKDDALFGYLV